MVLVLLFAAVAAYAQESEVPAEVKESFAKLYPKAKGVKWTVVPETEVNNIEYQAKTKVNGKAVVICMDSEGELTETKTAISSSKLPKEISKYIKATYPGSKVYEAYDITGRSGNKFYEAGVNLAGSKFTVYFDKDGKQVDKSDVDAEKSVLDFLGL